MPNSVMMYVLESSSLIAFDNVIYFAFIVNNAIVVCFREDHDIDASLNMKMYPFDQPN